MYKPRLSIGQNLQWLKKNQIIKLKWSINFKYTHGGTSVKYIGMNTLK